MSNQTKHIIILGAGLSGLLLAYRLKQAGFTVQVLEARDRIGGRIHTKNSENETPVELGATWFGEAHIQLKKLLKELQLESFEQFMTGKALFQAFSMAPPQLFEIPNDSPSYRIKGGTGAIIQALEQKLHPYEILLNQIVTNLDFSDSLCTIITKTDVFSADIVISTLPPALFSHAIQISPKLSDSFYSIASHTHTWMQDSIKAALIYKQPFWRTNGLSGTVFSQVGPFTELYDQCTFENSRYALCGFVSRGYAHLSEEQLKQTLIQQLVNLFGEQADEVLSVELTDWSTESYTKHEEQKYLDVYPHQYNGHAVFQQSYAENRLLFAGTETSTEFSGYMEGAVLSAERVFNQIKKMK
jgi:monoamine oxidase